MSAETELVSIQTIADMAAKIYTEKYKNDYEEKYLGWFAVIDVNTQSIFVGEFSDDAFAEAKTHSAGGPLHLIRIGYESAFRTGFLGSLEV